MPRVAPKTLKPFIFHGIDLSWETGKDEAIGDCPFCSRDNKFSVNIETGQWRCLVCGTGSEKGGGNAVSFLRYLWEESDKATNGASKDLMADRKYLFAETITHWGVCQSISSGDWLVPGYSPNKKLDQLYRWVMNVSAGKRRLYATPNCQHQIYGIQNWDDTKPDVFILEGIWDAMALWEVMRSSKIDDDGYLALTGVEANSLLAKTNIIAVPGCNVFQDNWASLLGDKNVTFIYHSDHPKDLPNGRVSPPAGFSGMKKAIEIVARSSECSPRSVSYLYWGQDGYDRTKLSGYDVRDWLSEGKTMAERVRLLKDLLGQIRPIPTDWVPGRQIFQGKGGTDLVCRPCNNWAELVNQWKKAVDWFDGLDRALANMLAAIASTPCAGDQLWFKVIGPASSGKSTLCEALSVNKRYVLAKSTIRGFHSGFKLDKEGTQDFSLLVQLKDKTLVTKDGDTLLQSPEKDKILSEARDIYDRVSRSHYLHGVSRDYEDLNMTWLLCGTNALRILDSSELGERFLDTVIVDDMDEEREKETGLRVAYTALRESCLHAGKKVENRDKALAKQMTGGYVEYLRQNIHEMAVDICDKCPDYYISQCRDLGMLVSMLRARPSKRQKEKAEREMSYRLVNQMTRLMVYLAAVLNKKDIDAEVMRRVSRVAFDTGRGMGLEIVKAIHEEGREGLTIQGVSMKTGHPEYEDRMQVRFMTKIRVLRESVIKSITRYTLSDNMRHIYEHCLGAAK